MALFILFGISASLILIIFYLTNSKYLVDSENGLSLKSCLTTSFKIYLLTLILGSISTSIVLNKYQEDAIEFLKNIILQFLGLMMYSVLYSILLVIPALFLALRYISRTTRSKVQKEFIFASISLILVLIINLFLTSFLVNFQFIIFLSGYSLFGIITPWGFVKFKKVFAG